MVHLPYLSVTRVTGPDAGSFLQSQFSADIEALDAGQATFSAYCSPRGQVLGLLMVCRTRTDFLLVCSSDLRDGIIKRLRIFVMRLKATFEDAQEMNVLGVTSDDQTPDGFEVFSPAPPALAYAIGTGACEAGGEVSSWKSNELMNGVAWLNGQTAERFIPQMLGQDEIGALSFTKGCYPGQEIVARTRYLGKVKRKPLVLAIRGLPEIANGSGLAIHFDGKAVNGTLIDSAGNSDGNTVLFIVTNILDNETAERVVFDNRVFQVV